MGTLVRNFLNTLRRFKLATSLNIASLAVAFAAFLVIMMQIDYERTFDRCYSTSDRIYRVDRMREANDYFGPVVPRAFFNAVAASSPHVEASSLLSLFSSPVYFMTVGEAAEQRGFREVMMFCYPDFVRIFDFQKVDGDLSCLSDPEKVIIPESMARRMFGNEQAVGQQINVEDNLPYKGNLSSFTVGAVYKDLPANTQLENVIYTAMDKVGENDWYGQSSLGYILLNSPESKEIVEDSFNKTFDFGQHGCPEKGAHLKLTPLADIYYLPNQITDFCKVGNPDIIKILLLIALLVMIVAGINFTNFSTSLAPMRIKSINTQKILGSSTAGLRLALVGEAIGISLLACLFSLAIVGVLNHLQILSFVEADTSLLHHTGLILLMVGISVVVGLIAGLYPSWYMTSFPPALVLKGSFGLSATGRKLRTVLIGFQYIVSIGLIIGASFIQLQNNYMRSLNLGFDKDQIAIVELSRQTYKQSKDVYASKLKAYPGIEDVAFSANIVGGSDTYSMNSQQYKGKEFYTYYIPVSRNFLKVMGFPITGGRDFNETDELRSDSVTTYIYSRSVQEKMDMAPGEYLDGGSYIAGFMGDVKLVSLRQNNFDMAFIMNGQTLPISYIRLKAGTNVEEAVEHIRQTVADIDPAYPFDIRFYDKVYDQLYQKEQYLKRMITLFSLLAIIISIVGVFGLVIFETQYRRKEIGIRKVHGATVGEILVMFNKVYLRIVLICFVIAAPIAWYGVYLWLENFAYRTPIYWWTFLIALFVVMAITFLTVTFQNWRAANENPVNSIKSE